MSYCRVVQSQCVYSICSASPLFVSFCGGWIVSTTCLHEILFPGRNMTAENVVMFQRANKYAAVSKSNYYERFHALGMVIWRLNINLVRNDRQPSKIKSSWKFITYLGVLLWNNWQTCWYDFYSGIPTYEIRVTNCETKEVSKICTLHSKGISFEVTRESVSQIQWTVGCWSGSNVVIETMKAFNVPTLPP